MSESRKEPAIIVSDTGPIISLLKINQLSLLQKLFSQVLIPPTVYKELMAGSFPNEREIIERARYIEICEVQPEYQITDLPAYIHTGEAEAMALSKQMSDETDTEVRLLVDDGAARNYAEKIGIQIIGTIGAIRFAREKNWIDSDQQIEEIIGIFKQTHRHYSEKDYSILRKSGDRNLNKRFSLIVKKPLEDSLDDIVKKFGRDGGKDTPR